jgi:hypothetical protein
VDDAIREKLRRRAEELASRPPIEEARSFLGAWVAPAGSLEEAGDGFRHLGPVPVQRALRAIEALLAEPQEEGVLANLVGWDANWVLDDPSDAGAAEFLREVAGLMRQALEQPNPNA